MNISESSPIVLGLSLVIAVFLWVEGYRLYKLAVFFLGFIVGFMLCGSVLKLFPPLPWPNIITQVAFGLLVGAASFMIVKLGLFVAAACAAFLVVNNLLSSGSLGVAGLAIAFACAVIAGFIATKADEPVVIILTGIVGGFAIPTILLKIAALIPYNTDFLPGERSVFWLIVKVALSVAGIGIQFLKKKSKED